MTEIVEKSLGKRVAANFPQIFAVIFVCYSV